MPIAKVAFNTTASHYVEVEVPDETTKDDLKEVARNLAYEKLEEEGFEELCFHCSENFDIGEFEIDDSENGVWFPDTKE